MNGHYSLANKKCDNIKSFKGIINEMQQSNKLSTLSFERAILKYFQVKSGNKIQFTSLAFVKKI